MLIEHNGHQYTTVMGSDVQRDGMFLELCSHAFPMPLMEVFYSDVDASFSVTGFGQPVPMAVVEQLLAEARLRLVPERPGLL